mmetsp:Transcript_17905/g.20688  ORF Transcript_17905/g.20688 Transcript_17905/m.20688 type:complete len:202 (+) Transcript_17905:225-830(+)
MSPSKNAPSKNADETERKDGPDEIAHESRKRRLVHEPAKASVTVSCTTPTVYVGNLHPRIAESHLLKLFQRFGDIHRIHIVRRNTNSGTASEGKRHGSTSSSRVDKQTLIYTYAFIEFKVIASAISAITKLHGHSLLGLSLVVRPANSSSKAPTSSGSSAGDNTVLAVKDSAGLKKEKNAVVNKIAEIKRTLEERNAKRRK